MSKLSNQTVLAFGRPVTLGHWVQMATPDPSPPCVDMDKTCEVCGERNAEWTTWSPRWTTSKDVCAECDHEVDEEWERFNYGE